MQIQDKTALRGKTQTERAAFGENSGALACCTVTGNMDQEQALDGPRTRRANATVVSTLARFRVTMDVVSDLRRRDPQQMTESPMPQAQQNPGRRMNGETMLSA